MSNTATLRFFDHKPGGLKANAMAVEFAQLKRLTQKTMENLRSMKNDFEDLLEMNSKMRITIIVFAIFFLAFVIAEVAISMDVYMNTAGNNSVIASLIVTAIIASGIVGSFLLKQPFTGNIPMGKLKKDRVKVEKENSYPTNVELLNSDIKDPVNVSSESATSWLFFLLGIGLVACVGYIILDASIERELFNKRMADYHSYDESLLSPFDESAEPASSSIDFKDLPITVWLPLLFFIGEVFTGWALVPFIRLIKLYVGTRSQTNRFENQMNKQEELSSNIVSLYDAYRRDIEEYNRRYNESVNPIPPNYQLRMILSQYDNGLNPLVNDDFSLQQSKVEGTPTGFEFEGQTVNHVENPIEVSEEEFIENVSDEVIENESADENSEPKENGSIEEEDDLPSFNNEEID